MPNVAQSSIDEAIRFLTSEETFKTIFRDLLGPRPDKKGVLAYAALVSSTDTYSRLLGRSVMRKVLEEMDRKFRDFPGRSDRYYVKHTRFRTMMTLLGEVTYRRTEYIDRTSGTPYIYVDEKIGLMQRQRYGCDVQARAYELYSNQNSMIKVGEVLGAMINPFNPVMDRRTKAIPKQEIWRTVNRIASIRIPPRRADSTPSVLYIAADEKWIPLQRTRDRRFSSMVKLAVIFEGRAPDTRKDGTKRKRYHLINRRYFASPADTENFWPRMADYLAVGKTYLSLDPDPRLYEAANPYDQDSRADTEAIFLWDAAYYNRRYYVYFGVVPCLMFQLPYYLAVGKTDLPVYVDCLFFAILFAAAAFLVVDQLVRRWYPRASKAVYYLSGAAILFGTPLLYTTSRPAIYSTAIISADAFMMLGFWQWLKAANTPADERSPAKGLIRHLMLGSFFMALTAGCRPTELIYIFLCLPLFYDLYIRRRRLKTRRGKMEILLFLVPFIVIAALQMRYNDLRFGSPINFGANYNLTTNDMTKRGCSPWRIMPALHSLLFQPPLISSVFPYICEIVPTTNLVGTHITQPTFGGILTAVPACWILYLTPVFRRRIKADKHALWYIELYMLAAAVIVTIADAQIAGILYRYIMDFAPGLLTAAVVLFMETEEWCQKTSSSPTAEERNFWLRKGMRLIILLTAIYQLLTIVRNEYPYQEFNPSLYAWLSRVVQFWL